MTHHANRRTVDEESKDAQQKVADIAEAVHLLWQRHGGIPEHVHNNLLAIDAEWNHRKQQEQEDATNKADQQTGG